VNLSLDNTAFVLDSTSDLPLRDDRPDTWHVVPAYVFFGEEQYHDALDLTAADFYRRLRARNEQPRTSQPSPADFAACFRKLERYSRIFVIVISARLSGTYTSAALAAAQTNPSRVRIIDSSTVSGAVVLLAEAIERRLRRGTSDEEVLALVENFRRNSRLLIALETLEYLIRGGRIGRATGFVGDLIDLKPVLQIVDGELVPARRVRGRARSLSALLSVFEAETQDRPGLHVGIAAADAAADAERLADAVHAVRPKANLDFRGEFGPAVGSHSGPGAVALFWFDDQDEP
jgi:DegV family protein with EDD domain